MAATLNNPDKLTSENKGAVQRRELFDTAGVCELFIPLAVDLAQQPNLLFNKLKLASENKGAVQRWEYLLTLQVFANFSLL